LNCYNVDTFYHLTTGNLF